MRFSEPQRHNVAMQHTKENVKRRGHRVCREHRVFTLLIFSQRPLRLCVSAVRLCFRYFLGTRSIYLL